MIITAKDKIPIEEKFRVEAGPGAGKTEFLANHIQNVVRNSNRLSRARKVACITYTNAGVETILKRLGNGCSQKVEVATIHSFLYRNIVKPYASFIPAEYGLNSRLLAGHDEITVSRKNINAWLDNSCFNDLKSPNKRDQIKKLDGQMDALRNWLNSIQCIFDGSEILFKCEQRKSFVERDGERQYPIKKSNLKILSENLCKLKEIYWRAGRIDHNDVLFFSIILINKYPFILETIRAKFPYIFLDEYQDTSPTQAYIVRRIKEKETVVGVIGDKVQSIYSFQGANPALFDEFEVEESNKYSIVENHRSSEEIVDLLNHLRTDIKQQPCNGKNGNKIRVLIGDSVSAYSEARKLCGQEVQSLSRDNITSNAMKKAVESSQIISEIKIKYEQVDGNPDRRKFVLDVIRSIELAQSGKFKEAIKYMEHALHVETDSKKQALRQISRLMAKYPLYSNGKMLPFYELIAPLAEKPIARVRAGRVKEFYETTDYKSMALCVNIPEDTSDHITIHKAKGNQFDNVFVVGTDDIKQFLLKPDLTKEEHRVAYVAFSRAKDRLFIQFDPSNFSPKDESTLNENYDMIQIIRL